MVVLIVLREPLGPVGILLGIARGDATQASIFGRAPQVTSCFVVFYK